MQQREKKHNGHGLLDDLIVALKHESNRRMDESNSTHKCR